MAKHREPKPDERGWIQTSRGRAYKPGVGSVWYTGTDNGGRWLAIPLYAGRKDGREFREIDEAKDWLDQAWMRRTTHK